MCVESDCERRGSGCSYVHAGNNSSDGTGNHLVELGLGKGDIGDHDGWNRSRLACDDWGDCLDKCNVGGTLVSCWDCVYSMGLFRWIGESIGIRLGFADNGSPGFGGYCIDNVYVFAIPDIEVVDVCDAHHCCSNEREKVQTNSICSNGNSFQSEPTSTECILCN